MFFVIMVFMSWAARRRLIYGGTAVVIMALLTSLFFFKFFYRAPTCSDGIKNGEETGIDCGGSCVNLCSAETLDPIVLWSKIFNISGDVYTLVSYVENPNLNSKNERANYEFRIYDDSNKLITVKEGQTSIPKGKKFAVFENGLVLKGSKPKSVEMEFTAFSSWVKDTGKDPEVTLKYGTLTSTSTIPRISGTVANDSTLNIKELELAVFVLDGNQNVVAASRSFVENLTKKSTQDFVFTWPKPFDLGVEACTAPLDIVLALDRSGSMRSEGLFPPEPFTTVTNTAKNFVKNLKTDDQVAVVTFGNLSQIENNLSLDKQSVISKIESLSLSTTTQENTNITAGLQDGFTELNSTLSRSGAKKAIILLTDGLPTLPVDPNNPDFPSLSAQQMSQNIKNGNVEIYTVGLGKNVSEGFLKLISTSDSHYFLSPTKETLASVYSRIATNLCQKKPNVINVIYK